MKKKPKARKSKKPKTCPKCLEPSDSLKKKDGKWTCPECEEAEAAEEAMHAEELRGSLEAMEYDEELDHAMSEELGHEGGKP